MKMIHSLQSLMAFAPYSLLVSKLPDSLYRTPATLWQGLPFSSKTKNALHAEKRASKGLKNYFYQKKKTLRSKQSLPLPSA